MENYGRTYRLLTWISILSGVCYYACILFLNEVPQDEGDGLQHFAFAQESWNNHSFFLEHWGKPFFTLFGSTFAQLGFNGYVSFNILVFALSCLVILKLLEHYQTPKLISYIFPWILITIPDYSNSVIGGMTEPFFGLILLTLFWLAVKKRWFWFALLASFAPFARSEGMLVVLAAVPYLLFFKQWKVVPLLAVGFGIYAIAGWYLLNQPLWYFENNPYSPLSVYGSGPWNTYILSLFDHLGLIAIGLLPFAIFGLFVWKSKGTKADLLHVLFFGGIYIGIIVIHSYLWANGLRGALGLSRLATLGLLPFLVIEAIALGYVLRELHRMTHVFCLLIVGLLIVKEVSELHLPTKASPHQLALKQASSYLKKHEGAVGKIYYFHPLITYYQGFNSKQKNKKYRHHYIHLNTDAEHLFKPGDILVRDSKFGSVEQGLDFQELEKYPWIVPVKHFYTSDFFLELSGEPKSVILYEVMDKATFDRQAWDKAQRALIKQSEEKPFVLKKAIQDEYYTIDENFEIPKLYGPCQELTVSVTLKKKGKEPVYLIFDTKGGYYLSLPLTPETKEVVMPFVTGNIKGLLFIHNPSLEPYQLTFTPKSWKQTVDSGIRPVK